MVKFKNMKIHVENNLDEIVGELERLGYKKNSLYNLWMKPDFVVCDSFGLISLIGGASTQVFLNQKICRFDLTTLAELRSMNIETLKEM